MHKPNPNDLKPCPHMRTLVSAWIDGKLRGVARIYTEWHVKHCSQCQSSLPFLRGLHERMRGLADEKPGGAGELPEERWSAVEAEWDKVDKALEKTEPR